MTGPVNVDTDLLRSVAASLTEVSEVIAAQGSEIGKFVTEISTVHAKAPEPISGEAGVTKGALIDGLSTVETAVDEQQKAATSASAACTQSAAEFDKNDTDSARIVDGVDTGNGKGPYDGQPNENAGPSEADEPEASESADDAVPA